MKVTAVQEGVVMHESLFLVRMTLGFSTTISCKGSTPLSESADKLHNEWLYLRGHTVYVIKAEN